MINGLISFADEEGSGLSVPVFQLIFAIMTLRGSPEQQLPVQDAWASAAQGTAAKQGEIPPFPGLKQRIRSIPRHLSDLAETKDR